MDSSGQSRKFTFHRAESPLRRQNHSRPPLDVKTTTTTTRVEEGPIISKQKEKEKKRKRVRRKKKKMARREAVQCSFHVSRLSAKSDETVLQIHGGASHFSSELSRSNALLVRWGAHASPRRCRVKLRRPNISVEPWRTERRGKPVGGSLSERVWAWKSLLGCNWSITGFIEIGNQPTITRTEAAVGIVIVIGIGIGIGIGD